MADGKSRFDLVAEGAKSSSDFQTPSIPVESPAALHPSVTALEDEFGEAVLRHEVVANNQHIVFIPPERSLEILTWLRDDPDQQYDLLRDVTAVDFGGGRPLQVVYQLFSFFHKQALRVKAELPLDAPLEIESVCGLWMAADWLEREVYDMFGITFNNHPDLRRILMPPDYAEGHPLRKDFPLRGRFSRAEQTRRALSQDLDHYYFDAEIKLGGESQALPPVEGPPALPPVGRDT
ncbi:MAG: NADH-quinone oxidoreductase subunit C [Longimicrobiales bacterium]|nr:NADH-quinone oxidoreductase subunit C [Longimicrobiales bacterium]